VYKSKYSKISGSSYSEIAKNARKIYHLYASKTKRKPYIRNHYFGNDKIFLDLFWEHLNQKSRIDRKRRLKFYRCGLDLIENSKCKPESKPNVDNPSEILHRFAGATVQGELFYVQIKQDKKNAKFFMSVFSPKKEKPRK
jgi:hypothetical protein